jgi:hypothetical protein
MKVRSQLELDGLLDNDLGWRKQELATILSVLASNKRKHERSALIRAAVCMLYAHWEGFAKAGAVAYLTYVLHQGKRLSELKPGFALLESAGDFKSSIQARSLGRFCRIFNDAEVSEVNCTFRPEICIETRSNLDSSSLRDLFSVTAMRYTRWWQTKEKWIDAVLIGRRNKVAHGESLYLTIDEIDDMHKITVEILEGLKTDIMNAATQSEYLK